MLPRTLSVLQVEDDTVDIDLFRRAVRQTGITITHDVVQDGEDALNFLFKRKEYAEVRRPDLILLDLNMPRKNGREVLTEIKKDRQLKLIPVVVLTNSTLDADISFCYDRGAACYVVKSADIIEFTAQIKKLLDFWYEVTVSPLAMS